MKITAAILGFVLAATLSAPVEARGGGGGGHCGGGHGGFSMGGHGFGGGMGFGYPGGGGGRMGGGSVGYSPGFSNAAQHVNPRYGYGFGYRRFGCGGRRFGFGNSLNYNGEPAYVPSPYTAFSGTVDPTLPRSAFVKQYSWPTSGNSQVAATPQAAPAKAIARSAGGVQ